MKPSGSKMGSDINVGGNVGGNAGGNAAELTAQQEANGDGEASESGMEEEVSQNNIPCELFFKINLVFLQLQCSMSIISEIFSQIPRLVNAQFLFVLAEAKPLFIIGDY